MKFGAIFAVALAMLSTPVMAARLTFADNIQLNVINGEAYKRSGLFSRSANNIELPSGDQQIVFRVFDTFRSGSNQELFRSQYYVMTFAAQGDETIKLGTAPLKSLAAARRFDANPRFILADNTGQAVSFKLTPLIKEGVQVTRDLVEELATFNASGHAAAITSRASFAARMAKSGASLLPADASGDTAADSSLNSEQMLRFWFEQADHTTRTRFLEWAETTMKASAAK